MEVVAPLPDTEAAVGADNPPTPSWVWWAIGGVAVFGLAVMGIAMLGIGGWQVDDTKSKADGPVPVAKGTSEIAHGLTAVSPVEQTKDGIDPDPKVAPSRTDGSKSNLKPDAPKSTDGTSVDPKQFTGIFRKARIARGEKSTTLHVGDSKYLLKIDPSAFQLKAADERAMSESRV